MTPESNGPLVDPNSVGNAFVRKYYNHLHESPAEAHKYYLEDSLFGRPGLDGNMVYVYTLKDINEQIMSCDYQNSRIQILTVDSQTYLKTGVATLVTGLVIRKDGERRTFFQSFFLVPQNGSYYVLNDILRYVSDESEANKEVPQVIEPAKEIVEAVTKPAKVLKEKVVSGNSNLPKVEEVAPKRSFAAIVGLHQLPAQECTPNNVKALPVKTKPVEKPKVVPEPKAPVPEQASSQGIFVGNLPMDATVKELYETFKGFGAIKERGIQVRSYQEQRSCFGFVTFENSEAVKKVFQADKESAIYIGNRRAFIQGKRGKKNENGARPSAQNNRNENGYGRNDKDKPRGNGSNGGQNSKASGDGKAYQKKTNGNAQTKK